MSELKPELETRFLNATKLHHSGYLEEALIKYSECLDENPHHPESHYNIGIVYAQLEQWHTAINHFQKAHEMCPHAPQILYNLCLAFVHTEQVGAAIVHLEKLLSFEQNHADAHHLIGCLYFQTGHLDKAEKHYLKALACHIEDEGQVCFNYAVMLMGKQVLPLAKQYLQRAVAKKPKFFEACYNLGIMHQVLGEDKEAVQVFRQAIVAEPDSFDARYQLVLSLKAQGEYQEALMVIEQALTFQESPTLRFMARVLGKNLVVEEIPETVISELFNQYATYYDSHLNHTLMYGLPKQMLNFLKPMIDSSQVNSTLDLGCGTGLLGELFRPYSKELVGVDVAKNMLVVAKEKDIYDELILKDILSYLSHANTQFDLILAGEVLNYFGALDGLFQRVREVLSDGGFFVFNVESPLVEEQRQYHFANTLRYQHAEAYVLGTLQKWGLKRIKSLSVTIRQHNQIDVMGRLYVAQKQSSNEIGCSTFSQ